MELHSDLHIDSHSELHSELHSDSHSDSHSNNAHQDLDDGTGVRDSRCQRKVVLPLPETEQSTSKSAGYKCAQCGKKHQLTMKDSVRCSECGYRVMYKLRDSALCMRYLAR